MKIKEIESILEKIKKYGKTVDYEGICLDRQNFDHWFDTWIKGSVEQIEELLR